MHLTSMTDEEKGFGESGISIESGNRLNITRYVTREWHTRSSTRNNPWERECTKESGFDPVDLWVMGPPRIGRVATCYAITTQGCQRIVCQLCQQQHRYQEQWTLRTIFLLVNTRRTNWQSSRPGGYRNVINNGNKGYWRGSTPRCLHKQGIIAAQIIYITRKIKQTNGR